MLAGWYGSRECGVTMLTGWYASGEYGVTMLAGWYGSRKCGVTMFAIVLYLVWFTALLLKMAILCI